MPKTSVMVRVKGAGRWYSGALDTQKSPILSALGGVQADDGIVIERAVDVWEQVAGQWM